MKIFIVEDEQISVFIVLQMLISEGIAEEKNINTFQSAEKALNSLRSCRVEEWPDVLLLDLSMPGMDGWEFLEALAPLELTIRSRCKIYIVTTSLNFADEARAKANPMVSGFFQKPIKREDIRRLKTESGKKEEE